MPSRKKHQITQPNTAPATTRAVCSTKCPRRSSVIAIKTSVLETDRKQSSASHSELPELGDRQHLQPTLGLSRRAILLHRAKHFAFAGLLLAGSLVGTVSAEESPIDRLQKRSADERWRQAASEWLQVEPEGAPQIAPSSVPEKTDFPSLNTFQEIPEPVADSANAPLKEPVKSVSEYEQTHQGIGEEIPSLEIDTTFSLFEPFPGKPVGKQTPAAKSVAETQLRMTKVVEEAKPAQETTIPSEAPQLFIPPQVIDLETASVSSGEDTSRATGRSPKRTQFALVNQSKKISPFESGIPQLRKISEILPHHDYAPIRERNEASQRVKPIDAEGPKYLALPATGDLESNMPPMYYHWMASNLTHDPLYFEDVSLERYGHQYPECVQPFVSLSKFGVQFIGLPYQMALNPVDCEQYPLGYYRPGDCAPFLRYRIPFNKKAAATAAGAYTGLIFLIP